ncbi:MAG TPA: hypothetical protein PK514_12555 [Spirochaetota bacterium]|nr:hypothetical protein [Spirochaetota bacterium]
MEVQNISGSDVVASRFTAEYSPKTENAPQDNRNEEVRSERPPEPNKGANVDRLA